METKLTLNLIACVVSCSALLLSSCANRTGIDNSKLFNEVESFFIRNEKTTSYDYADYFIDAKDSEAHQTSFYCYNRFNFGEYYKKENYTFKAELPFSSDSNKRFLLYCNDGNISQGEADRLTYYVSNSFADIFSNFITESDFVVSDDEHIPLTKILTLDNEYIVYVDGTIGMRQGDDVRYSKDVFPLESVFLEFASIRSRFNVDDFYSILCNNQFELTYGERTIKIDNFSDFFSSDGSDKNKIYYSYLINSKEFNSINGIEISYKPYAGSNDEVSYYLMPNGSIVQDISGSFFSTLGYSAACNLVFKNGHQYKVYFTKLDTNKIFSLFN